MSNNRQIVSIDPIRSLGFASISGTYTAVGGVFSKPVRLICLTNNTDGDMFWSVDGVSDYLFTAAGSFKLFDLCTNRTHMDPYWVLPANTQLYVRYNTAPTKNAVYAECLWGQ